MVSSDRRSFYLLLLASRPNCSFGRKRKWKSQRVILYLINFIVQGPPRVTTTSLVPMFTQPSASSSFNSRISQQRICLESAFMEGTDSIAGTVRVVNISFHKTVIIRWTINDWASTAESTASYVKGSSRDGTDQFRFKLELAAAGSLAVGGRVQFCLKYICEGEHWDSNGGANYVFQVLNCHFDALISFPT